MTDRERIERIKKIIDNTIIKQNEGKYALTETKELVDIVYTLEMLQQLEERLDNE